MYSQFILEHDTQHSRLWRFSITFSNQLPNNQILLREALLPALKILQLLRIEILQIIQRRLEVLSEHFPIEALKGQTTGSIASGKILVRSAL